MGKAVLSQKASILCAHKLQGIAQANIYSIPKGRQLINNCDNLWLIKTTVNPILGSLINSSYRICLKDSRKISAIKE